MKPSLKLMIVNEWSVFLMALLPLLFSMLIMLSFIRDEYPFSDYHAYDFVVSFLLISLLSFCMWPFILWWYSRLLKVFDKNMIIEALVVNEFGSDSIFSLYINVEYKFNYMGEDIKHNASLVSNSKTKKVLRNGTIQVLYDPDLKLSFIKEIYVE